MPTRIQIKRRTIRNNKIPHNLLRYQSQALDYLANCVANFNFKKNKFFVGKNIEIAPAKDKVVDNFFGTPLYEFGDMSDSIVRPQKSSNKTFYFWLKDSDIATRCAKKFSEINSNNDEVMMKLWLNVPKNKKQYPIVRLDVDALYGVLMDYKATYEHNQVKRANGKIDKYFTETYNYRDKDNLLRKFFNMIILDTRVDWVKRYQSKSGKWRKGFEHGYPR